MVRPCPSSPPSSPRTKPKSAARIWSRKAASSGPWTARRNSCAATPSQGYSSYSSTSLVALSSASFRAICRSPKPRKITPCSPSATASSRRSPRSSCPSPRVFWFPRRASKALPMLHCSHSSADTPAPWPCRPACLSRSASFRPSPLCPSSHWARCSEAWPISRPSAINSRHRLRSRKKPRNLSPPNPPKSRSQRPSRWISSG